MASLATFQLSRASVVCVPEESAQIVHALTAAKIASVCGLHRGNRLSILLKVRESKPSPSLRGGG